MIRSKFLLVGVLLAVATPAFAQNAPGVAAPAGAAEDATSGPMIDRPLVLAAGRLGAYADLEFLGFNDTATAAGMTATLSLTELAVHGGVAYGVIDKLTAGVEYTVPFYASLSLDGMSTSETFPNNGQGPLTAYLDYALPDMGRLSIAATAAFLADFSASNNDPLLNFGVSIRYKVASMINVFTGSPIPMGLLGQQLEIGLDGQGTLVQIPVGIGVQLVPEVYVFADTTVAQFAFANGSTESSYIFSDTTPLGVGGFYAATKQLDVGAQLAFPDLGNAGTLFTIAASARWHE